MTRHGMIRPSAAGTQPPARDPHASMPVIENEGRASGRATNQQHRAEAQQSALSASIPALPDGGRAIDETGGNPKSP
jgi:hypothetical protein